MKILFYTSTAILLVTLAIAMWYIYGHGKRLNDEAFQLRRKSFTAFFIALQLYVASTLIIYSHGKVEVLNTLTVCMHYSTMLVFTMMSCALLGRNYHRNVLLWAFFMQYPVEMLVLHIIMRTKAYYVKIYSLDALLSYNGDNLGLFWGRAIWLAILTFCFLFLMCMIIEAYIYYRKHPASASVPASRLNWRSKDVRGLPFYFITLLGMTGSLLASSLWPYVVTALLMTVMVAHTIMVYMRYMHYIEQLTSRHDAFLLIPALLKELAEQERNNPLYKSNATLDEIAAALGVDRKDFSDYIYEELGTTFPSWTSEQKLDHFTQQLLRTDRKISELAMACGYASITALNRAFKARYGMSPSDYRSKTSPPEIGGNLLMAKR